MTRIWKWPLRLTEVQVVEMPVGAKLLDVQMQGPDCCLWALCDPSGPRVWRKLAIYGTGTPMPDEPGDYVGTFQAQGGTLVVHLFDLS
jgi:hypothetical protein